MSDDGDGDRSGVTVAELADRSRTTDPTTVYDDLDALPDWWRTAVEEFAAHDLRPYRPSRFDDGTVAPPVVDAVEEEYGVTVRFMAVDPGSDDDWQLYVDGEPVATVAHRRDPRGYTVYGISSAEFEETVAAATTDA